MRNGKWSPYPEGFIYDLFCEINESEWNLTSELANCMLVWYTTSGWWLFTNRNSTSGNVDKLKMPIMNDKIFKCFKPKKDVLFELAIVFNNKLVGIRLDSLKNLMISDASSFFERLFYRCFFTHLWIGNIWTDKFRARGSPFNDLFVTMELFWSHMTSW